MISFLMCDVTLQYKKKKHEKNHCVLCVIYVCYGYPHDNLHCVLVVFIATLSHSINFLCRARLITQNSTCNYFILNFPLQKNNSNKRKEQFHNLHTAARSQCVCMSACECVAIRPKHTTNRNSKNCNFLLLRMCVCVCAIFWQTFNMKTTIPNIG